MPRVPWWRWVLAGVSVAACAAFYLWHRFVRGDSRRAAGTMADTVEAWTIPKIEAAAGRLAELEKDVQKNSATILREMEHVDELKGKLRAEYTRLDLSPEDMARRLRRLPI